MIAAETVLIYITTVFFKLILYSAKNFACWLSDTTYNEININVEKVQRISIRI